VYYLYQALQYGLVLALVGITWRFGRINSLSPAVTAILVAGLFLVNNPLVRTVRHDQVNLWMLLLYLSAVMVVARRPAAAGFAMALGTHLKLFAIVLLPVWVWTRRWRAAAWGVAWLLLLWLPQGVGPWRQFLAFYTTQPLDRFLRYRNNSLRSVIDGTVRALQTAGVDLGSRADQLESILMALALGAVALWFGWRLWQWTVGPWATRTTGLALDALAVVLIAAPITWEHHYVAAIPLVVWAFARNERARWPRLVVAAVLMLGVPTFDVFPLSYHRLVGLLLLVAATPPARPQLVEVTEAAVEPNG
jgi:hypothetical protein